jgi:hypothetical protein
MGKLILLTILVLILMPSLFAIQIAYVVNDNDDVRPEVTSLLSSEGYLYTIVEDDAINSTNFTAFDLIVVFDHLLPHAEDLPIGDVKSFIANTYYLDDWDIAEYAGSHTSTGIEKARILVRNDITDTLLSPVEVYTDRNLVLHNLPHFARRAPGVRNIVSTNNADQYPVIGLIDSGYSLLSGRLVDERIAFFGITDTEHWTAGSSTLFTRTLHWLLNGEDADGDGFFSDIDCNDEDTSVHPGALETPYDGIDQDCNGFDVTDIDQDGFDAEEVGGNDCDDTRSLINPNATDVFLNCINDAPIVDTIGDLFVREGNHIDVVIPAIDPEGDKLVYFIDDARFSLLNNTFSWNTTFDDFGSYTFTVFVSDSEFTVNQTFTVSVRNTNQVPHCEEIPPIVWDEDSTTAMFVSTYCTDLDGDLLIYGLHETSAATHINLDSFVNGTAQFSVEQDWFGDDWITFAVFDGKDITITNVVNLTVTPVHDAPLFLENISAIQWVEDTSLIEYIDLDQYFSDVDSENLTYTVSGNSLIDIHINEGLVSFYPDRDFFGIEHVIFTASDGEFSTESNSITLEVVDANEPPEFGTFDCETVIVEDVEERCNLNASDVEGDTFLFTISEEINATCSIFGTELSYVSTLNYFGPASCVVRVSDAFGYSEYLFNVTISEENDEPRVTNFSPRDNVRLLEGNTETFSISGTDVEGNISIQWFLDGTLVGSGDSYFFNESFGQYALVASLSDGVTIVEKIWNVFVGVTSDFMCEEVGGHICTEDQYCPIDVIDVTDTTACCVVTCLQKPPQFKDIKNRCESLNSTISIAIEEPDSGEDFVLGETLSVIYDVTHSYSDKHDFEVVTYFYNLDKEDTVDREKISFSLKEDKTHEVIKDFIIEADLEDGPYAVFVYVEDEDSGFCNEKYVTFDVERKDYEVVFDVITVPPIAQCGEQVFIEARVTNEGSRDVDVYLLVEGQSIDLNARSKTVELEEYGEDDSTRFELLVDIPENIEGKEYDLRVSAIFNSERVSETKTIQIDCNSEQPATNNPYVINSDVIQLQSSPLEPDSFFQSFFEFLSWFFGGS